MRLWRLSCCAPLALEQGSLPSAAPPALPERSALIIRSAYASCPAAATHEPGSLAARVFHLNRDMGGKPSRAERGGAAAGALESLFCTTADVLVRPLL